MNITRRKLVAGAAAVPLFGIVGRARAAVSLRVAHSSPDKSLIQDALLKFKADVEAKTSGACEIQIFANAVLGDEGPVAEAVGAGSIDMGLGGVVDAIDPRLSVVSLPFLFKDFAAVHRVLDGPIGGELAAMAEPRGYSILGVLDSGFRSFTNNKKPIVTPEDLKGLKVRCPPIPVAIETMKAFGALAQSIPYGEVYTALQSGVVDGAEPELRDFYDAKWFEVQKYLSISNYMWMANYWFMNKAKLDGLDAGVRDAILAAAKDTQAWYREGIVKVYEGVIADLQKAGIQVNTVDTAPFIKLAEPVYEIFAKEYGAELVKKVRAAAAA